MRQDETVETVRPSRLAYVTQLTLGEKERKAKVIRTTPGRLPEHQPRD